MSGDLNQFVDMFKKGMVMKANMKRKGLKAAKAKCPYCEGHWFAVLAGPKQHLHMRCDTCGVQMME